MQFKYGGIAMASNELIIDDDYCKKMGSFYVKQGEQIDALIADYISILEEVKSKGIISGNVSQALAAYINYVKKLKKQIGRVSTPIKTEIDRFLAKVDSEDQYLF